MPRLPEDLKVLQREYDIVDDAACDARPGSRRRANLLRRLTRIQRKIDDHPHWDPRGQPSPPLMQFRTLKKSDIQKGRRGVRGQSIVRPSDDTIEVADAERRGHPQ